MVPRDAPSPLIAIVDLDMGNLRSVSNAVSHCGLDHRVVTRAAELEGCSHLIVPGVGSFAIAMARMAERDLRSAIRDFAATGRPVLGICLGMQLLASRGEEGGRTDGLDLIPGSVVRFREDAVPAIPHVGWNEVRIRTRHPCFDRVKNGVDFYFVHSYHLVPDDPSDLLGTVEYGGADHAAAVARGNVLGLQFHPEKSQANGLRVLQNFCDWDPRC